MCSLHFPRHPVPFLSFRAESCSRQCRYYLRSLGANPRKEPSNVQAAFPELAADLSLPHPPAPHSFFSSVLRISSGERASCARTQRRAIQHVFPPQCMPALPAMPLTRCSDAQEHCAMSIVSSCSCASSCHTQGCHAGGLRLWTHFDVMSNLLCQISGTKHIRVWPPSQVHHHVRNTTKHGCQVAEHARSMYWHTCIISTIGLSGCWD